MNSAGSSNHPGDCCFWPEGGLFPQSGDNPLLKEDASFGKFDANIEKLGKIIGSNNLYILNINESINCFPIRAAEKTDAKHEKLAIFISKSDFDRLCCSVSKSGSVVCAQLVELY